MRKPSTAGLIFSEYKERRDKKLKPRKVVKEKCGIF